MIGTTVKTAVLPGFFKIEDDCGSTSMLVVAAVPVV